MSKHKALQSLLLRWFKHHRSRSQQQIHSACTNLLNSYSMDSTSALYKLHFPLVRQGYVEFSGNGSYEVSKPVVLHYKKLEMNVAVNFDSDLASTIEGDLPQLDIDDFGVFRFSGNLDLIKNKLQDKDVPIIQPRTENFLANFPQIEELVQAFDDFPMVKPCVRWRQRTYSWPKWKKEENCIFKAADDAQRLFLLMQGRNIKVIPPNKTNPEAFPLATCAVASLTKKDYLKYNSKHEKLTISDVTIPLLIDRTLRMASMATIGGAIVRNNSTTYTNISKATLPELERIFKTRICVLK